MDEEIKKAISNDNDTLYVFIGNELREDDGAGPYIARNIKNNKIKFIDAHSVFENYISDIIELKPKKIVIMDAAFFEGVAGEIKILDEKNLKSYKIISTHTLPLNTFLDYIRGELKDVNIIILGIQPKRVGYEEKISDEVKKTCDEVINYLNYVS